MHRLIYIKTALIYWLVLVDISANSKNLSENKNCNLHFLIAIRICFKGNNNIKNIVDWKWRNKICSDSNIVGTSL